MLWKNVPAVKAIIGIGLIVKALLLEPMETNTRVSGSTVKQFGQGAFLIKFIHLRFAFDGYGDCDVFILA